MSDIYIPIETKVREFDGKLLMTTHLLDKGHNVFIGSRHAINKQLLIKRDAIYMPKSITLALTDFYKELKARNHKIYLLHAEGGILHKEISESIKYSYPHELMQYIDKIFLYGSAIKEALLKYVPTVKEEQLIISGEPRFDLLKPRFNSFFEKEITEIKQKHDSFILINTSFGLSNHLISDDYANKLIESNPDFSPELKDLLFKKKKAFKSVFEAFKELGAVLAKNYPDMNFILRPHPEESPMPYEEHYKDITNIQVIKRGNVAFWIRAAQVVIHYDCTTGVETYMANKPVISYTPEKDEELVAWLPIMVSQEISTLEGVVKQIGTFINNGFEVEKKLKNVKDEMLAQYISNVVLDTALICKEKIPEKIEAVESSFQNQIIDRRRQFYHFIKDTTIDYYRKIKPEKVTTSSQKLGYLETQEIKTKISALKTIEGLNFDFKVQEVHYNFIKISRI